MKVVNSYFVKLSNGTFAWLSVEKAIPEGATIIEERPVIVPNESCVLKHIDTGKVSYGHWLRGDDSMDKWEEIEEPQTDGEVTL